MSVLLTETWVLLAVLAVAVRKQTLTVPVVQAQQTKVSLADLQNCIQVVAVVVQDLLV
jgi:hypothetical protein